MLQIDMIYRFYFLLIINNIIRRILNIKEDMSKQTDKALSYSDITKDFKKQAIKLKNITLTNRQLCDLELILNKAFNPVKGFMNKDDYESVVNKMRLCDGSLWPIPITLDISNDLIKSYNLKKDHKVALRDKEGFLIAILKIILLLLMIIKIQLEIEKFY